MDNSFNYPPKEFISTYSKNNEFFLLWMLLNNEFNTWSSDNFSKKYGINLPKLNFAIIRIVEDSIYPIKLFKLEIEKDINYFFQVNEKLEKIFRAIVEDHIAKSTYLYDLSAEEFDRAIKLNKKNWFIYQNYIRI